MFSTIGTGGVQSNLVRNDLIVSYYVANPSSTTYLSLERPIIGSVDDRNCQFCDNVTLKTQQWQFAIPTQNAVVMGCDKSYNDYGYGLDGLKPDYVAKYSSLKAKAQYKLRNVVYMSGESDICDTPYMTANNCTDCTVTDGGLDTSCPAYIQGWCRMARLHAFSQYINRFLYKQEVHRLLSIPYVGHSGCGMFQSSEFAVDSFMLSK